MPSSSTGFLSGSWDVFGMSISKKLIVFGLVAAAILVIAIVVYYRKSDDDESAFRGASSRFVRGVKKTRPTSSGYLFSTNRPQTAEDLAQEALEEDMNAVRGRRIFSDTQLPSAPLSDSLFRVFPEYGRDEITSNPLVRLQTTPSNPGASIF